MLVNMRDMLYHAYENGYAVGAFDLVSLDFLQAIVGAAERSRAPVILSLAESHFDYLDPELLLPAVEAAARRAAVPMAIHLDHGAHLDSAVQAIRLGCNGVMVDASQEPLEDNIAHTRAVVEMAHGCGVPVEGELGYVAGVEGEDAERHPGELVYTTPAEAKTYVERAGVDFLAVSIGTLHGRLQGRAKLDFQRLEQINAAVNMPLVIHGGTGLSDEQFRRLINGGVAKINYYTALADAAGARIRDNVEADRQGGYTALVRGVTEAIGAEVERCMRLWGSAGRAAEVLRQCRVWRSVKHLILYNVAGMGETEVEDMMAAGRRTLGAIPGVREVFTGRSVQDRAAYRYCWLVRFCHPDVIDGYRDHPAHVAFANELFRPLARERISIDYEELRMEVSASKADHQASQARALNP